MIARTLLLSLAAAALCACAGIVDLCDDGLPDGPPGRALTR